MTKEAEVVDALNEAVTETFAEMAFMEAIPAEERFERPYVGQLLSITFANPVSGQLVLYLPREVKATIAEYVYGTEWKDLRSGQIDDCLLELLNVLAGNFLKRLGEEEGPHGISLPQLLFDDSDIEFPQEKIIMHYDVEGYAMIVKAWCN